MNSGDGERARVGRVLELGDLLDAVVERQPRARVVGAAAERHEAPRLQRGLVTAEDEDGALVRPHREPRAVGAERELRRGARDAARLEHAFGELEVRARVPEEDALRLGARGEHALVRRVAVQPLDVLAVALHHLGEAVPLAAAGTRLEPLELFAGGGAVVVELEPPQVALVGPDQSSPFPFASVSSALIPGAGCPGTRASSSTMKSGEHAAAAESYSGSPSLGALQNLMTPPAPPVMSCQPPPSVLRFPLPLPLAPQHDRLHRLAVRLLAVAPAQLVGEVPHRLLGGA